MIGKGGSSKVYKVMDDAGGVFALKRVKSITDEAVMTGYRNEIAILRKLKGCDRIIRLVAWEEQESVLMMILEYGEVDLETLIKQYGLDPTQVRYYWSEMLQCVAQIHAANIIHSDLKPANFLMMKGRLVLIDFGISKTTGMDTTRIQRDFQTGTVNYMAPECILYAEGGTILKQGRKSDVWALGCILYRMVVGHPPFGHLGLIQKIHAITHDTPIDMQACPAAVASVLVGCLQRDVAKRSSISELQKHVYLNPDMWMEGKVLARILKRASDLGLTRSNSAEIASQICLEMTKM